MSLKLEIVSVRLHAEMDEDPDVSYLKQDYEGCDDAAEMQAQDVTRLEEYAAGSWCMLGIYAQAETRFTLPEGGWLSGPEVRSGGLWGIESDSGSSYFDTIADEELEQLGEQLEALGLSREAIAAAFANAGRDWS